MGVIVAVSAGINWVGNTIGVEAEGGVEVATSVGSTVGASVGSSLKIGVAVAVRVGSADGGVSVGMGVSSRIFVGITSVGFSFVSVTGGESFEKGRVTTTTIFWVATGRMICVESIVFTKGATVGVENCNCKFGRK